MHRFGPGLYHEAAARKPQHFDCDDRGHGALRTCRGRAGTVVTGRQPSFGPVSIESHFDEVFGAAGVAEQLRLAQGEGFDAVVIACFGDPGLDAARELTTAPVLGIAESAFHAASFVATGFSVVTTMTRTCVIAERLVQRYGFERTCRGIHGTDIPVLALEDCGEDTVAHDRSRGAPRSGAGPQRRHRARLRRHGGAVPQPAAAPGRARHRWCVGGGEAGRGAGRARA